ncbi:MAG TPA: hypothetical protein DEO30_08225 [Lactococcus sp.]|nr:hypothetical protein RU88_GL000325 [Lactococcus raffinolactis]HBZ60869.1 hypothetical protein [Lactococcus sp.]
MVWSCIMQITFLLGNGFDIQCGLKTSYIDFYKYILKKKYSINLTKEIDKELALKIDNIIYSEIYKSKDNIENWADLELQLGVFTKRLKKRLNEPDQDVQKIANKFLNDFEILREDLNEYLKYIQIQDEIEISEDFSDILSTTMDKFFEGVFSREYDELNYILKENRNSAFIYNFISFNYTNSLQEIIQSCGEISKRNIFNGSGLNQFINKKIINVHGLIDNLLTLGLNDETQLATDFFDMSDLNDLIKPKLLEINREYMRRDAEIIIDNSDIIVIFGMSIGSTDKHWWEKIANVLINSKNKKLIIHLYDEKPSLLSPRIARKRRESKENEFLSQLNNLDLSDEQKVQLRKQIYIVTNSEYILNVDLRKYLNQDKNESTNVIGLETKGNSKAV